MRGNAWSSTVATLFRSPRSSAAPSTAEVLTQALERMQTGGRAIGSMRWDGGGECTLGAIASVLFDGEIPDSWSMLDELDAVQVLASVIREVAAPEMRLALIFYSAPHQVIYRYNDLNTDEAVFAVMRKAIAKAEERDRPARLDPRYVIPAPATPLAPANELLCAANTQHAGAEVYA